MKTSMKVFLGIVIGLVIVVALAVVGSVVFNHWQGSNWMMGNRNYQVDGDKRAWNWDIVPEQRNPSNRLPLGNMPMHSYRGAPASRFGIFRLVPMLFCGLVTFGFLVLLVLGVVYLAGGLRRPKQPAVPSETPGSLEATPPAPAPVQNTAVVCPHCAQPLQEGWKHCPNCGAPLTEQT